MKDLKIVVTACGCPGASTLIRMLKRNHQERKITIIGTDMDKEAIGRFLTSKFYQVPPGGSEDYIPVMMDILEKERPDVLFPESSYEVLHLAKAKKELESTGTKVLVSNPEAIRTANNKLEMYERLKQETSIELPEYYPVESLDDFLEKVELLGYPEKAVLFKPQIGKGSRGVRIIDRNVSRKEQLLQYKPNSKFMSLEEFKQIFENEPHFPKLLLMEFLEGVEATADTIALEGEELLTTIKTVEQARWGVIVRGELVKRPELVQQTREILKAIPLSYCNNIQFIGDKLIEINPRVSTFIYQENLVAPYIAIKLLLKEITKEEVRDYSKKIDYGLRMIRYMDQIFHKNDQKLF
ncbi:MAG: ATP-grasp domain-containing protein [Candidatus Heimdallarchaeota archaeon]|nr:ATP-grasp domain-containing protein [Candidatus Heimdallarchaeota archaeon]